MNFIRPALLYWLSKCFSLTINIVHTYQTIFSIAMRDFCKSVHTLILPYPRSDEGVCESSAHVTDRASGLGRAKPLFTTGFCLHFHCDLIIWGHQHPASLTLVRIPYVTTLQLIDFTELIKKWKWFLVFTLIYSLECVNTLKGMALGVWKTQWLLYTLSKLSEVIQTNNSNGVNSGKY